MIARSKKPIPVPVKPLNLNMQGDWGWCGVEKLDEHLPGLTGQSKRHFRYLTWQVWREPGLPVLPICERCALTLMEAGGHGRRLPYESQIPKALGGTFDPPLTFPGDCRSRSGRKPCRKRKRPISKRRLQAVIAALECRPHTWQQLAALADEDGPLFNTARPVASVKRLMNSRLAGSYTAEGGGRHCRVFLISGEARLSG